MKWRAAGALEPAISSINRVCYAFFSDPVTHLPLPPHLSLDTSARASCKGIPTREIHSWEGGFEQGTTAEFCSAFL